MKILHVIFSMLTGGAETMLVDIASEQARRGHEVTVLVVNKGINEELVAGFDPSVRVDRFNRTQGAMPLLLLARLNMYLLRQRPDVIHLHSHKLPALVRVFRKRVVFTVHDINTPMHYARGVRMAAISGAVRDYVLGVDPSASIRVIQNGIVVPAIAVRPDGNDNPRPFRIVQVARLMASKKGQDILIDAVALLRARGLDVTATFIGGGDELDELRERARDKGVAQFVEFEGARNRAYIYARLRDFDIMCHPSRYEGFGLTVAEGMAAGLPLVVPEYDGPWEVAGRGAYCRPFVSGDVASCADALESIIRDYPSALRTAALARTYVADRFSVARMVTDYLAYYPHPD